MSARIAELEREKSQRVAKKVRDLEDNETTLEPES